MSRQLSELEYPFSNHDKRRNRILCLYLYILRVKFPACLYPNIMKIYQCQNCNMVFRRESDRDDHSKVDASHQKYREYELEEFLTRFLVAS
jgi:hypothetical protein